MGREGVTAPEPPPHTHRRPSPGGLFPWGKFVQKREKPLKAESPVCCTEVVWAVSVCRRGQPPAPPEDLVAQGQASGPRLRPGEQSCGRLLTAPAPPVPPHAARLSGSRSSHPPHTAESGSREQRASASLRGFSTVRVLRGKQDGRPRDAHSPGSSAWGPEGRGEEVQPATSSAHLAQRCPTRRGSRGVLGLRGQR